MEDEYKLCSICGKRQPVDQFYPRNAPCKSCLKEKYRNSLPKFKVCTICGKRREAKQYQKYSRQCNYCLSTRRRQLRRAKKQLENTDQLQMEQAIARGKKLREEREQKSSKLLQPDESPNIVHIDGIEEPYRMPLALMMEVA